MGGLHVDIMSFFQIIVPILLLLFIVMIIYLNVREITQWRNAAKQPVLIILAKALRKRSQVIHHVHQFEIHLYHPFSTYYFVTFELENGNIIELEMNAVEFNQITEGDAGMLTYQGIELLDFLHIEKG